MRQGLQCSGRGNQSRGSSAKLSEPMWTLFFELHTGPVAQVTTRGLTHDR
jgi:hypothetical protein